jgi:hypothetical protein
LALGPHEVLGVHDAHDVVDPLAARGDAAVAVQDHDLHGVGNAEVRRHGDHVGARHHDLTHHGVAELDHRLDEPALLGLDHLVLHGQVGHRQELLLRRVRAPLEALAGEQHVGEPDQPPRHEAQRTPAGQRLDRAGGGQRGAVGVLDGPGLGGHLGDDEEERDVDERGRHHAPASEQAAGQDAEQRRLHELGRQHDEQRGVEPLLVLHQRQQHLAAAAARLGQRAGLCLRHAGEGRLGHRQHDREQEQEDDGGEDRPVRGGELDGDHQRAWW